MASFPETNHAVSVVLKAFRRAAALRCDTLLLVNSQDLLLRVTHAADVRDREGGLLLTDTMFGMFPFLLKLNADIGY